MNSTPKAEQQFHKMLNFYGPRYKNTRNLKYYPNKNKKQAVTK